MIPTTSRVPEPAKASVQPTRTDRRVLLNTGALAGSSLWRIGLSFVLQVMIANRLGAHGLGQYVTALAYLNVSQVVSELGLPPFLVRELAPSPQDRGRAFRQALTLQFLAGVLVWLGLVGLTWLLPYAPETRRVLWVATASLPFFAVTSACETLFQAAERMELVMGVEMTINALIVVASLAVLAWGGGVLYLAAVLVGSQAVSALLCLIILVRTRLLRPPTRAGEEGRRTLRGAWRDLLRQARPFYGLALANVFLQRTDILLLSAVAGERITGIYSAAYLIVRVFLVLSQTYWQALYPTLSRLYRQDAAQYVRLARLAVRYGLMGLLPGAAMLAAVAPQLMALLFPGADPLAAAEVLRLLTWVAPLFFLAHGAVNLLLVEHHPRASLAVALTHLAGTVLLLPPLTRAADAQGAGMAVLLAIGASSGMGLYLLRRVQAPVTLPRHSLRIALAALVSGGLVTIALRFVHGDLVWIPVAVLGGLLYVAFLWSTALFSPEDRALFRKALRG